MPQDFKFDPETRDLVDDARGSFEMTDAADTMVMHQWWCHYRKWWGDSTLGSLFYDLSNFLPNPELRVVDEATRALGVIAARGRIANVQSIAKMLAPGRIGAQSTFQDVSSGQVVTTFAKAGG